MSIRYAVDEPITSEQFTAVLRASLLAERRPVDDPVCIDSMLEHANLIVSAWDGDELVGVARSVTDFAFCCYLSDLAVDKRHQRKGIGLRLQHLTRQQLGPKCVVILLAAPAAADYYPQVGYSQHPGCWVLWPGRELKS